MQDFESQLDAALDALPSLCWASTSALRMASELYEIGAIKNGIDSVDPVEAAKEAPLQARVNGAEELAQSGDTAYLVIGDLASARDLRLS